MIHSTPKRNKNILIQNLITVVVPLTDQLIRCLFLQTMTHPMSLKQLLLATTSTAPSPNINTSDSKIIPPQSTQTVPKRLLINKSYFFFGEGDGERRQNG